MLFGTALQWISYLTNRSQYAKLENIFHPNTELQNIGCCQASVLRPCSTIYVSRVAPLLCHFIVNQVTNTLMIFNFSSLSLSLQPLATYTHLNPLLAVLCHLLSLQRLALNPDKSDANSVLLGVPHFVTNKLQWIQNTLGKIVLEFDSLAQPELLLQQIHWLPVQSRI
jgi:hypothetical protein